MADKEWSRSTNERIQDAEKRGHCAYVRFHIFGTGSVDRPIRIIQAKTSSDKVTESTNYFVLLLNSGKWEEYRLGEDQIVFY